MIGIRNLIFKKCDKVGITKIKIEPNINTKSLQELYEIALGEDGYSSYKGYLDYFTSDENGRVIYVAHGLYLADKHVLILINQDGNYNIETCIYELSNKHNYKDELINFKKINNWGNPI